ncbi:TonB-dependent outer membrane receptor [Perkinsela sp. CCAP 1560/4]|nr:TonB-dependent outer membrane receptor [Perkinsela sp. CCAP 1560/4]|eukprot:KNH08134.1 TonB-dependent outer membrane receptor [Perkinsela sp. CCAP 1560/4]
MGNVSKKGVVHSDVPCIPKTGTPCEDGPVFNLPPKEIIMEDSEFSNNSPLGEEAGFEFLHIAQREKSNGNDLARQLLLDHSKSTSLQKESLCTIELPSTAFTFNAQTNEKASGKVGKLTIDDSGGVTATICGNTYDVFGHEPYSSKQIIAIISGSDFGKVADDGIHIGSVSRTLRFVPRIG